MMMKIVVLVSAFAAITALAQDTCPQISCVNTNSACHMESDPATSKNYCNNGFCWKNPSTGTNTCKSAGAATSACYGPGTCERVSKCLDSNGLCWKPNVETGPCSKSGSCKELLACDLNGETCRTPWQVKHTDNDRTCGQDTHEWTYFLCEENAYCSAYPAGMCNMWLNAGGACTLPGAITIDGVVVTATGQMDYIRTGQDVMGMNWNPCGPGICANSVCQSSWSMGDGVACTYDRQCVSGICGRNGLCAPHVAPSNVACVNDTSCTNQGQLCKCDYTSGNMFCMPKYSSGEITRQRELISCYVDKGEKDKCEQELKNFQDEMAKTDSNPCVN